MNEEKVIAGLVTFLKARATTLSDPIIVIGLGDEIPNEGVRIQIEESEIEPVAAGLGYLDIDFLVIGPAKQDGAAAAYTAACGFLRRALSPRDEAQRDALRAAILTSTANASTVRFYHHGKSPGDPPEDPHRYQRKQRLRLGLSDPAI